MCSAKDSVVSSVAFMMASVVWEGTVKLGIFNDSTPITDAV